MPLGQRVCLQYDDTEARFYPVFHKEAVAGDLDGNISSRSFPSPASPGSWGLGAPGLPPAGMGHWGSPRWAERGCWPWGWVNSCRWEAVGH